MNILTTLFSFCGRHNLRTILVDIGVRAVVLIILGRWLVNSYASATQPAEKAAVVTIIICWLAIVLWFQTANLVKRLHDLDASGWWTLPIYLIGLCVCGTSSGGWSASPRWYLVNSGYIWPCDTRYYCYP